jgi:hypothetical protein
MHRIRLALVLTILLIFTASPFRVSASEKKPVRITEQTMVAFPKSEDAIEIVQIVLFENKGNTKEQELPILLPEGYSNLQIRGGLAEDDVKEINNGIVDTSGLEAGEEKQITLSYQMPMEKKVSQWKLEQSYVTETIDVVIQPGILSFQANDLVTQSDLFEMNGQEFRRFTRLNLHPEEPWTLSFRLILESESSQPQNKSGEDLRKQKYTEDGYRIIGQEGLGYGKAAVTLSIIIVAFSSALIGLKRDLQNTYSPKAKSPSTWLKKEKDGIFGQLLQLENDFDERLIGEETYQAEKQKLRDQLVRLTAEMKKRTS